jgi:hypothetical protein
MLILAETRHYGVCRVIDTQLNAEWIMILLVEHLMAV